MAVQLLLVLLLGVNVSYRGGGCCWIIVRVGLPVLVFVRYHHEGIHRALFQFQLPSSWCLCSSVMLSDMM